MPTEKSNMHIALGMLREIGHQLDRDIFPRIMNGGFVTPGEPASINLTWAKEKQNEQQGQRRSETRPWTGAAGGKRETNRSGTTGNTAPVICTDLQSQYEDELTEVHEAYPGAKVWHQKEGLWLLTETSLLPGLWQRAVFFTGIPFSRKHIVRSWGFWVGIPLSRPIWIGPRHTNFPDGSVCAYEISDGTWNVGDSLVELLDMYSLWAFRQLHLQVVKQWPGRQVAHLPFERLTELKSAEYCGCGSNRPYEECCQESDLRKNQLLEANRFLMLGQRRPPLAVERFMQKQDSPPRIQDFLPTFEVTVHGDYVLRTNC